MNNERVHTKSRRAVIFIWMKACLRGALTLNMAKKQIFYFCYGRFQTSMEAKANCKVSGPILQTKAENLAKMVGLESFLSSSGWLSRFKQQHGIHFRITSVNLMQ